jgi:hypothetical protein
MRVDPAAGLTDRVSTGGRSSGGRGAVRRTKRGSSWPEVALAAIWIALLLFAVGYVTVKGEAAISEFDALDLSAYSTSP